MTVSSTKCKRQRINMCPKTLSVDQEIFNSYEEDS